MAKRFVGARQILTQTTSQPGYNHYLTPLRKLIIDYDPHAAHQDGVRTWLKKPFLRTARENPDVEFVVRPLRQGKAAVLRGHYVNGRDKVICVDRLDPNNVQKKIDILLNSSGVKIKHLKNLQLEAPKGAESARGIWSILHEHSKPHGGYII